MGSSGENELTNGKGKHLPFWESGSGHYGKTLGFANRQIIASSEDFILSYLDTVPVERNKVFTIADYGTNDGYSSMPLLYQMIYHLRKKHGEGLAIQVIYEDQEKNDFNSLFNRICDKGSPTSEFGNVYCLATNTNFYKQCVPDATCDVIFTCITTHWLENTDTKFKDSVFHVFATEEENRQHLREAERDWEKFLLLRARELKSGGLFIALNLSAPDEAFCNDILPQSISPSDHSGQTTVEQRKTQRDIYKDLEASWKQLKEEKVITEEEYEECSFALVIRTSKEITAPFERVNSPVRQAGLTLVYHDQTVLQHLFLPSGTKNAVDEDRYQFAERLVEAHRVWNQTIFESSLSHKRSTEEKTAILDRLYKEVKRRVMEKNPENYRDDHYVSRLIVRKI